MHETISSSTAHQIPGRGWYRAAPHAVTLAVTAAIGLQAVTADPQVTSDDAVWDRFNNLPAVTQLDSSSTHVDGMGGWGFSL